MQPAFHPGMLEQYSEQMTDGVVRLLEQVGETEPGEGAFEGTASLELDPAWPRSNLRAVAFIQDPSSRQVLAIGQASLAP